MDDKYFTIVFKGHIRELDFNPATAKTIFGEVVASGVGNAFEKIEKLEAELEEINSRDFTDADEN